MTVSPYPQPGARTPPYEGCSRPSENGSCTEGLEVYDSHPCPQASLSPQSMPLDVAVESVPAFSRFKGLEILRSLGRSTTLSLTGSGDLCTAFDYDSSKKGGSEERRRAGQETSSRRSRGSSGIIDFLVAMGMLLMSTLVTILIMIHGTQSWLISLLYIIFKIVDFIIGYLAARQANRVLYILTLVITIVVLVGGIYFAARAIVGIVDHPTFFESEYDDDTGTRKGNPLSSTSPLAHYVGVMPSEDAEKVVTRPTSFCLYHQMPMNLADMRKALYKSSPDVISPTVPLFVAYRSRKGQAL
ncbi:hypothetical protein Q1695_010224 [Nippostrongylus brasiliensis]|nr:hypothetical protein Q1695_010224 [Nippostrongylus brasiliensis]